MAINRYPTLDMFDDAIDKVVKVRAIVKRVVGKPAGKKKVKKVKGKGKK